MSDAISWTTRLPSHELDKKFLFFRIPGDEFQKAKATLTLFALHPKRDVIRAAIRRLLDVQSLAASLGGPIFFVPPLDINFYLSDPDEFHRGSFYAARGGARMLRRQGSQQVQLAIDSTTVAGFHAALYAALASYRGAFEILSKLKELEKHVPTLWEYLSFDATEIHRWWVECEEARVTITTSLRECAVHSNWNVARPYRILATADWLSRTDGADSSSKFVLDLCVRLIIPRFVCDILLAVIANRTGTQVERRLKRITAVIAKLESELATSVKLGEPPYLFYAYAVCGSLAEKVGLVSVSDDMSKRQSELYDRVRTLVRQ